MKILIPPSEGKAKVKSTKTLFGDTNFKFYREVNQVVRLLELIGDEDLRSVYGTSAEKALMFHRQNQDIFNSPCAPAIERYTGVVYEHIDWITLSEKAKKYMEKYVLIFSGLFGILTPMTPIPNYKLKMNVLSLQHHWKPILTEALQDENPIIDLLPQVHRLVLLGHVRGLGLLEVVQRRHFCRGQGPVVDADVVDLAVKIIVPCCVATNVKRISRPRKDCIDSGGDL